MKRDLTMQLFGRLLALMPYGRDKHQNVTWLFICLCGNPVVRVGSNVTNGHTQSCGCLNSELSSQRAKVNLDSTTHGHAFKGKVSSTYRSWQAMRERCDSPNHRGYPQYGAKGITYDSTWKVFENFLADVGERSEGTTLGRAMDTGNYVPGNCWWQSRAEQLEQARLKRTMKKPCASVSMQEMAA